MNIHQLWTDKVDQLIEASEDLYFGKGNFTYLSTVEQAWFSALLNRLEEDVTRLREAFSSTVSSRLADGSEAPD